MKRLFTFLRIDRYFTLFLFLMSYLLVINSRIRVDHDIISILQPDAPIAQFLGVFIIIILIKLTIDYFQKKNAATSHSAKIYLTCFALSFILYLIASNAISLAIAIGFDTVSRNFNQQTLVLTNLGRAVDFALFGSLYLAYLFLKDNRDYKNQIHEYDKALSSSVIQQLKAQLNPHFLFNNLNTLDELIEEDPTLASAFLHHFSELYRYALDTSEKKLVPLHEEIDFVNSYFKLMEHKYRGYYFLNIAYEEQSPQVFVPPFCLQLLVENAIEHNLGRSSAPVNISISITDKIIVSNTKIPKKTTKKTGGRALKNLSTQFNLLGGEAIKIEDSETQFIVTLPFITRPTDV